MNTEYISISIWTVSILLVHLLADSVTEFEFRFFHWIRWKWYHHFIKATHFLSYSHIHEFHLAKLNHLRVLFATMLSKLFSSNSSSLSFHVTLKDSCVKMLRYVFLFRPNVIWIENIFFSYIKYQMKFVKQFLCVARVKPWRTPYKTTNKKQMEHVKQYTLWIGYSVNNCEIQLHSSWVIEIVSHSFNSVRWLSTNTHKHKDGTLNVSQRTNRLLLCSLLLLSLLQLVYRCCSFQCILPYCPTLFNLCNCICVCQNDAK